MVSVDPSSPFTQGALLGDRIRLDHFLDPDVYIRSMGTRGHLGGLAEATLQTLLLVDASGKDLVFLETVGTGQSEVEVIGIADVVLLVLMPGSGDAVQALKAGIMEIPDVIAINKMDHPRPTRCCRRCAPSSRSIPSASGALGSCARRRSGVKACPSCGTPWSRGGTSWPSAASSRSGGDGTCAARSRRSRSPASASSWSARSTTTGGSASSWRGAPREVDPLTAVGAVVDAVLAGGPMSERPTVDDIRDAQERLHGVAVTAVYSSETLSRLSGRSVLLKAENLQRTGAFKIRGPTTRSPSCRRTSEDGAC